MNIPFTIPSSPDLEKAFIAEATQLGMVRLCWSMQAVHCMQAGLRALTLTAGCSPVTVAALRCHRALFACTSGGASFVALRLLPCSGHHD